MPSANCSDELPESEEFYDGISDIERGFVIACSVLTLIDFIILVDNVLFIWRKHTTLKAAVITSTWLVALCPILALIALMAMVVPNAFLYRDVIVSVCVSVVLYKFVQLLRAYFENYAEVREQIRSKEISFNVRPLCCCCVCLPKAKISPTKMRTLRMLVLQYPIIMMSMIVVSMVTWLDGKYHPGKWRAANAYPYLSVIRVTSMLIALYAINVMVAICQDVMKSFYVKQKFTALSLCIMFFSVQGLVFSIMTANGVFNFRGCYAGPIMGKFYENVAYNIEVSLLTLFNLWSYRRPLGEPVNLSCQGMGSPAMDDLEEQRPMEHTNPTYIPDIKSDHLEKADQGIKLGMPVANEKSNGKDNQQQSLPTAVYHNETDNDGSSLKNSPHNMANQVQTNAANGIPETQTGVYSISEVDPNSERLSVRL